MKGLIALSLLFTTTAFAGTTCTSEPQDKWLNAQGFQEKLAKDYRIITFKTTAGHCYEIYGFNRDGKRVEIYFNPVNGEIVKSKVQ